MRERTWKTFAAALLLTPALMVIGCKSGGDSDGGDADTGLVLAEPVEILANGTGDSPAIKIAGVMLIKTQAEYDALGDATIADGVNFDEQDLVIAALGEQPTGGYAIQITSLQLEGDAIIVVGTVSVPGADAVTTQALTYPYAAAVIANTDATSAVADID